MSYFNKFPVVPYDVNGDGTVVIVTNILKRVRLRANMKKELTLLDQYEVQEGETPEIVADKHHGSVYYHWVILMTNGITDPFHDWPKSTRQLQLYLADKYTPTQLNQAHHYEISQSSGDTSTKIEVYNNLALYTGDTDFYSDASIITNREYEEREQDKKRQIRLLDPSFIDQFVEEFKLLMKESVL